MDLLRQLAIALKHGTLRPMGLEHLMLEEPLIQAMQL
jgi:hypothetical protein